MSVLERIKSSDLRTRLSIRVKPYVVRNGYWNESLVDDNEAKFELLRLAKLGEAALMAAETKDIFDDESLCPSWQFEQLTACKKGCKWLEFCQLRKSELRK